MHGFTVFQENNPKEPVFHPWNPYPAPNSSVGLTPLAQRLSNCQLDPIVVFISTETRADALYESARPRRLASCTGIESAHP
jgi:hypothetical protein